MPIEARNLPIEVKQVVADMMKEDTNITVILSDLLIKLSETRE